MAIAFHYGSLAIHFSGSLNGIWIVTSQWISPIAHDHCHHHLVWLLPPVTLLSKKYPKVGLLMIPKTCAYAWVIITGLPL
mgnify:CR=1 FL=1